MKEGRLYVFCGLNLLMPCKLKRTDLLLIVSILLPLQQLLLPV
jgi:hypothetical protein